MPGSVGGPRTDNTQFWKGTHEQFTHSNESIAHQTPPGKTKQDICDTLH